VRKRLNDQRPIALRCAAKPVDKCVKRIILRIVKRQPRPERDVNCEVCGKLFRTNLSWQQTCGKYCRKEKHKSTGSGINASSGTVGAIAELRVSAHLMANGHETYRALSQASSSDIITLKDGMVFRFEIRSAVRLKSGGISYPKYKIRAENVALFIHRESALLFIPECPIPILKIPQHSIP
jgi:hypothetical protein